MYEGWRDIETAPRDELPADKREFNYEWVRREMARDPSHAFVH